MRDRRATGGLLGAATALLVALALTGCAAGPGAAPSTAPTAAAAAARPDTAKAAGLQDPVPDGDGSDAGTSSVVPVRVVIPSIDVDASLLDLRRDADGVLAAPPADQLDKAGWYTRGTVPGRVGPAVIAGHVDWVDRVAVFHRLDELAAGDEISVVMSDRTTVRFTVDRSTSVEKFDFPTAEVYGPTPDAQLRVITCGGPWDDARNIYSENVVVFASLTA